MTATYIISADQDVITCPGCRRCIPGDEHCDCPVRTPGPGAEPVLPWLVAEQASALDN